MALYLSMAIQPTFKTQQMDDEADPRM